MASISPIFVKSSLHVLSLPWSISASVPLRTRTSRLQHATTRHASKNCSPCRRPTARHSAHRIDLPSSDHLLLPPSPPPLLCRRQPDPLHIPGNPAVRNSATDRFQAHASIVDKKATSRATVLQGPSATSGPCSRIFLPKRRRNLHR